MLLLQFYIKVKSEFNSLQHVPTTASILHTICIKNLKIYYRI